MTKKLTPEEVWKIRDELDVSQALLSRAMNIEAQTIHKYETGERTARGAAVMLLLLLDRRPELFFDLIELQENRFLDNEERMKLRKKGGRKSALQKVKIDGKPISMDLNYRKRR